MERFGGRYEKMEGHFSTGESTQWSVVPMEEKKKECLARHVSGTYAHHQEH